MSAVTRFIHWFDIHCC